MLCCNRAWSHQSSHKRHTDGSVASEELHICTWLITHEAYVRPLVRQHRVAGRSVAKMQQTRVINARRLLRGVNLQL